MTAATDPIIIARGLRKSFGTLTAVLHKELLRGDRAALALACFIAIFWTTRIGVDFLYYDHKDWPEGRVFVYGHILLTSVFAGLAVTYWGLLLRHLTFQ